MRELQPPVDRDADIYVIRDFEMTFFSFTPPNFFGGVRDTNFRVGLRGSVDSVAIRPPTPDPRLPNPVGGRGGGHQPPII